MQEAFSLSFSTAESDLDSVLDLVATGWRDRVDNVGDASALQAELLLKVQDLMKSNEHRADAALRMELNRVETAILEKMEKRLLQQQQKQQQESFLRLRALAERPRRLDELGSRRQAEEEEATDGQQLPQPPPSGRPSLADNVQIDMIEERRLEIEWGHPLSSGTFAEVFAGSLDGNEEVAVKRILRSDDATLRSFRREALGLQLASHPNIVRFRGAVVTERDRMLVMERAVFSLHDALHGSLRGQLDWNTKLNLLEDVASGLRFLHRHNTLHRDLKPSNILLFRQQQESTAEGSIVWTAKLTDFGLSVAVSMLGSTSAATSTVAGQGTIGSRAYMAPELFAVPVSWEAVRSSKLDVYSLGIVMNEVLTNGIPWKNEDPNRLFQIVSEQRRQPASKTGDLKTEERLLVELIGTAEIDCLAQNPAARQDMKSVVGQLQLLRNKDEW